MSITHLEPSALWRNFSALNAVPRPSKKEGRVIAFIKKFGESLNLETRVDETGNVIILKPATPGMEGRKKVILQSHLDMVCQKNNDTEFDFDTQGIRMVTDSDWVMAEGTTLGADNGIGVAAIMSILESKEIDHPELEALFTIDEETGMTGAFGLKPGALSGDILLNLDTEEDDEIDIGCAGGMDVTATGQFITESYSGIGIQIEIKGLRGGHSGIDIHEGRGNANVILTRFLFLGLNDDIRLVNINGGGLRNAIPREAKAVVVFTQGSHFLQQAEQLKVEILHEYLTLEPTLEINISPSEVNAAIMNTADSGSFIRSLKVAHNGVFRMSPTVPGLVEASNNIARVTLDDGKITVMNLTRSSVDSTKQAVAEQLRAAFELSRMEVTYSGSYPGWQPNPHSSIVELMQRIYVNKFGSAPKVVACHAGLECGIIGAHYPKMEMVSFGPTIQGAHSPEERVNIKSVGKFWSYLLDILKEIPEK
ncbi:MAG: aminoacyl-histidine dipeptidase [Saprospiraceae bacterium]|jgi:dipeptidase D|nr:aminoacyl-histidine dipeptidase [Saprospiraceae bacterium]MBX7180120.1 aminoacyl-histidine dipeptidase [Saprospiraceae bacterium]MCB0592391.1 aminoacyl-histidine dipeptidase [Saprospiraceae bacterium]MCO6471361.1 aminoacyl-histidine dipeptidase [Saprospiraceae bacterium]HMY85630.1 aminoacyl-histidine dipeptidase [Saprospiraceae bacterium]